MTNIECTLKMKVFASLTTVIENENVHIDDVISLIYFLILFILPNDNFNTIR